MVSKKKQTKVGDDKAIKRLGKDDLEVGSVLSEDNSHLDSSSTSQTMTNKVPEFASNESRNVFRARVAVIFILALVSAGISTGVYIITSRAQEAEFDAQWKGNSLKIMNSFEEIFKEKFGALSTLGVSFTSYASGNNAIFQSSTHIKRIESR